MSAAELILITIIALIVLKPADLKSVAKFLKDTIAYFGKVKNEIWGLIEDEKSISKDEQELINNYLAKIIQIAGKYEGKYNLAEVKACYHKLLLTRK